MANLMTELTSKCTNGTITANLAEIEASVDAKLAELHSIVYEGTRDERIIMMKEDRSDCNKAIKSLEDGRKNVKKKFMLPYDNFESEIKRIVGKINECASEIDVTVKNLEEERRAEKRQDIRNYYDSIKEPVGDFADTLYANVYQTSWENVSTSAKTYKDALQGAVDKYLNGSALIESMDCDADLKEKAFDMFKSSLDAVTSVSFINNEMKKRAEYRARIEAEAMRKAEEEKQRALREAEEEKQRALREAEEARQREIEAAAIEAARAERERIEQEQKKAASMMMPAESIPSASTMVVPDATTTPGKKLVEFDLDDWDMVKAYCDRMQIFYFENN